MESSPSRFFVKPIRKINNILYKINNSTQESIRWQEEYDLEVIEEDEEDLKELDFTEEVAVNKLLDGFSYSSCIKYKNKNTKEEKELKDLMTLTINSTVSFFFFSIAIMYILMCFNF